MSTRSTNRSGDKSFDRSFDRFSSRSGSQNSSYNSRSNFRSRNNSFNSSNSSNQTRQSFGPRLNGQSSTFQQGTTDTKTSLITIKATVLTNVGNQQNLTTADQCRRHR